MHTARPTDTTSPLYRARVIAGKAGVFDPTTPQAIDWLNTVANDAVEHATELFHDEIAAYAVNNLQANTHRLWTVFTDLGAYREDPCVVPGEMEDRACEALYAIALRVIESAQKTAGVGGYPYP